MECWRRCVNRKFPTCARESRSNKSAVAEAAGRIRGARSSAEASPQENYTNRRPADNHAAASPYSSNLAAWRTPVLLLGGRLHTSQQWLTRAVSTLGELSCGAATDGSHVTMERKQRFWRVSRMEMNTSKKNNGTLTRKDFGTGDEGFSSEHVRCLPP